MRELNSVDDWMGVLADDRAVLYKHSPICGLSHRALPQVERFAEQRPDVPIYTVNVIRRRKVSNRIAEDLGVRHESPQVIVLSAGQLQWHASHRGVTAEGILEALDVDTVPNDDEEPA